MAQEENNSAEVIPTGVGIRQGSGGWGRAGDEEEEGGDLDTVGIPAPPPHTPVSALPVLWVPAPGCPVSADPAMSLMPLSPSRLLTTVTPSLSSRASSLGSWGDSNPHTHPARYPAPHSPHLQPVSERCPSFRHILAPHPSHWPHAGALGTPHPPTHQEPSEL